MRINFKQSSSLLDIQLILSLSCTNLKYDPRLTDSRPIGRVRNEYGITGSKGQLQRNYEAQMMERMWCLYSEIIYASWSLRTLLWWKSVVCFRHEVFSGTLGGTLLKVMRWRRRRRHDCETMSRGSSPSSVEHTASVGRFSGTVTRCLTKCGEVAQRWHEDDKFAQSIGPCLARLVALSNS
jgi:hypothetical protein